ncbi:MAG: fumarylacetoacetate hydrolase family protein [Nocardioidaceae bacterium]
MRLCTFQRPDGSVGHGRVDDPTLIEVLGEGDLQAVVTDPGAVSATGSTEPVDGVQILAPLLQPGKILAAATNYQEHIVEGGGTPVDKARTSPKLFTKPDTALIGPGAPFVLPEISDTADWEVELAVVIGRAARGVAATEALDHVFGYATSNDISLRSLTLGYERDDGPNVGFFDWLEGKWADGSAPIGPWLVTTDDIPDPQRLGIRLELNGETRQESSTAEMIFSVAELVSFASRLCTLRPGDIILTGTPAGVGASTSTYLRDGDLVVAEVDGLGRLETPIVSEQVAVR